MSEIIIKNLNKSYGNNKVINEFNIKITDGEFGLVYAIATLVSSFLFIKFEFFM